MGTAQVIFEGVLPEVTWPEVTLVTWPEVPLFTWPKVTSVTCPVMKYVLRMRNRKLRHIRPSGAFLTGSDKVTWPEGALTGSRFCACPDFSLRFFLSSSNMATEGHLTPSGFPWVCACATGSCTTPVVTEGHVIPFGSVLGVFSTTSVSYNHRKPRILYLAWWLELALVICPFYFRIVSI
jgi:hypothetical protein